MLNVIMLNVVMLSVVMLSVVVPKCPADFFGRFYLKVLLDQPSKVKWPDKV
jgi:hypothetical protein